MTKGGASHGLPLEETITIINNSGKLISSGKQILSVFKTAAASYREKRIELKQERTAERSTQRTHIQRSQTFDPTRSVSRRHHHSRHDDPDDDKRSRRAYDDQSVASSRRSRGTRSRHHDDDDTESLALTEDNLKALAVVSKAAPSRPPVAYHSPYAETAPRGALSKPSLDHSELRSIAPTEWTQAVIPRPASESQLAIRHKHDKEVDMHLAYGDVPPDLHERTDLDPRDPKEEEDKAEELIHKIEDLLDQAHCVQHSATAIIKHLQEKPQAAAAVALALAELSSFVAKLSPGFVALLKGGSPAVFALLASPQFLIGTGIAVGVTVVMFGGWKIMQKVTESQAKQAVAFEGSPLAGIPEAADPGVDEALVVQRVEKELSTIETWRRGIPPSWENADLELITPTADRATRERRASREVPRDPKDPKDDFDSKSRRSSRTHRSSATHKTHKSGHGRESSDKKSRRGDDEASVAPSSTSKKSSRKKEVKSLDDGRSVKGEELPFTTKPRLQNNMLKALFKGGKKDRSQAVTA